MKVVGMGVTGRKATEVKRVEISTGIGWNIQDLDCAKKKKGGKGDSN